MSIPATSTFIPVRITRGRKFKGDAFIIPGEFVSRFGYAGSGVCPLQITRKVKIWDPAKKVTDWINVDYCEDRDLAPEAREAQWLDYVRSIIASTIAWCKSKNPSDFMNFARNVIRKNHADMLDVFDKDNSTDASHDIKSTFEWVMTLRTPKGNSYTKPKLARIAYRALEKKGLTSLDGFKEAWTIHCDMYGLPNKLEDCSEDDSVE